MPQKCCVPGCKSNYNSQEYVSVFTFPSDPDLKEKWIQLIGRKDYVVNKNSVVCAKHFQPDFVVTVDCVRRHDGTLLCVPRTKPKLQPDAFPTIFPQASSTSAESSKKIKVESEKLDKQESDESESVHRSRDIKDNIASFQSLCKEINSHIHHRNSVSRLSTGSQNVDGTHLQLSKEAEQGEEAYITLKMEFLEQQRKYMHTFTDHYIDRMIKEGKSWTRNTVVNRRNFTEMCQNLDKAVEFLCLMCEELSSTVTADIKDGKLTHPEHCQTSLELPDSASGDASAASATSDPQQQTLTSGQTTGMYSCPHCSTVFSHHGMLHKHITQVHSSDSGKDSQASDEKPAEYSSRSVNKGGSCEDDEDNKLEHVKKENSECGEYNSRLIKIEDCCKDDESNELEHVNKGSPEIVEDDENNELEHVNKESPEIVEDDENNELEHVNKECPEIVKDSCGIQTGGKTSSRCVKKGSRAVPKAANADEVIKGKLNITDKRNVGGNQKQTRSRGVKKLDKSDACDTSYESVGGLQTHKRKHKSGTSTSNISELIEASSHQIKQENTEVLTDDNQHMEDGNTNETLQETIYGDEINAEERVINKCHKQRSRKRIRLYKPEKPLKCDICNTGFHSMNRLLSHKKKHQGGQSFQCEICDAGFDRSYQLKAHTSKHTGVKPFHCNVCDAGFTVKSTMQIHMRKHTGEKPYVCDDCGAKFINRRKLKIHRVSHTGEKPYKCDVCEAGFNQAFSLQLHKRKHTGEKPYKCDVCGLKFAGNCSLKMHKRRHTGEKPYRCDVCGVGFTHSIGLQIHKSKHKGEKPFVCEICGLKFSVNCSLQYHKRKHTGDKPYQCDVCFVTFSVKTSLINHVRKHTGETPYSCDICGLRFSVITSLQNHMRKHTGEKPYLCDICGTEFAHSGSLRDHKRLHTGEKPYKCSTCGADFSNRKKLQRHKKMHDEESFYTSGVSGLDFSESNDVQLV